MPTPEQRGDSSEFNPDAELMRYITVTAIDPLVRESVLRKTRISRTDYYLEIEPILQRLEKKACGSGQ